MLSNQESESAVHNVASALHDDRKDILPSFQAILKDRNDWKQIALDLAGYLQDSTGRIKVDVEDYQEEFVVMPSHLKDSIKEFIKAENISQFMP